MKTTIIRQLDSWPQAFIRSYALQELMQKRGAAFHSAVQRAVKSGELRRITRGLYQINKRLIDRFELAQELHGPSFVSLESALSYHQWIPEAVYTCTSACMKRGMDIETSVGTFCYSAVPSKHFYLGVERVAGEATFLIASPWRAIADMVHSQQRSWSNLRHLSEDLRIEPEDIWTSNITTLQDLAANYPNERVRSSLRRLLKPLIG